MADMSKGRSTKGRVNQPRYVGRQTRDKCTHTLFDWQPIFIAGDADTDRSIKDSITFTRLFWINKIEEDWFFNI